MSDELDKVRLTVTREQGREILNAVRDGDMTASRELICAALRATGDLPDDSPPDSELGVWVVTDGFVDLMDRRALQ